LGDDPVLIALSRSRTAGAPSRWRKRIVELLLFVLPFLVIGGLWELLVRTGVVAMPGVPAPSQILLKFRDLAFGEGLLWKHLGRSLYRLGVGYALAMGSGVLVGTTLAMNRTLREMFSPVLSLLISVPTIAWVPVFLIILGLGDRTVITVVFLGGFFAITYNTIRGIEMVDVNRIRAARTMGARHLSLFTTILLPGSLVSILTGMRLGIGYSWRALVGGEMLSAMLTWGVGKMIYQARFWNDVTVMFVGLMIIGVTGFVFDRLLIRGLERLTVERWGMLAER
jgi:NitT/TauT family transport system permease protein